VDCNQQPASASGNRRLRTAIERNEKSMNLKQALDKAIVTDPTLIVQMPPTHYFRHDIAEIVKIATRIDPTSQLDAMNSILLQYPFGNISEFIRVNSSPRLSGVKTAITEYQNAFNRLNSEIRSFATLSRSPLGHHVEF